MSATRTGPEPWRCATAARAREDTMFATAGPAARLLLVEVNGPWGRDALRDSRFDRYLAGRLQDVVDAAGVRLVLVRRPGRHADSAAAAGHRRVAVADLRTGREAVHWRSLEDPHELLELDLLAPVTAQGPQQVALVCTHGRHDVCCALRGRPVAAALGAVPGWDVWECSHLGGDRFAPNVLLLPQGDLFGGLDPEGAVRLVTGYGAGRIALEHHRGRFGRPAIEQAALHHAAAAWGETRRGALAVTAVEEVDGQRWVATVTREPGGEEPGPRSARVRLTGRWTEPARLTCQAPRAGRVLQYVLEGVQPTG